MRTRIISGVIMAAGGIVALIVGGYVAGIIVMLIALGAYYELCKACQLIDNEKRPINAATIIGYLAIILFYINLMWKVATPQIFNPVLLIIVVLWHLAVYVFTYPRFKTGQIMAGVFNLLYAPLMLSYLYPIMTEFENGKFLVVLVFIASSVSDACAYFVGVSIGKHKLAPVVSPKKSIEGSIGGIVGAAVIGLIYGLVLNKCGIFATADVIWGFAIIGGLGSIISQIGDLAASAIKRDHDIKDYSHLIPGHGGIMDRMDSICVTAPIIYYLAILLIK